MVHARGGKFDINDMINEHKKRIITFPIQFAGQVASKQQWGLFFPHSKRCV